MKTRDKIIELYYICGILEKIRDDLLKELDETDNDGDAVNLGKHINDLTLITNVLNHNIELYVEEFNITLKQLKKFKYKASNTYNIYQQPDGFKAKQELVDLSKKYNKDIGVELNKILDKKGEELTNTDIKLDGTYHNI